MTKPADSSYDGYRNYESLKHEPKEQGYPEQISKLLEDILTNHPGVLGKNDHKATFKYKDNQIDIVGDRNNTYLELRSGNMILKVKIDKTKEKVEEVITESTNGGKKFKPLSKDQLKKGSTQAIINSWLEKNVA